jgi:putative tryptophan/tyrosine transport system substrate-binding protein
MKISLRRREFIAALGGAAAWPVTARAQQPAMPVIAFLQLAPVRNLPPSSAAFRQGLAEAGYVPGRNVTLYEYDRGVNSSFDLPRVAAELVDRKPAVIVTSGSPYAAVAAKAATSTIPIVFFMLDDPMKYGLVASYNRPGSNATGVSFRNTELSGKRLNLLVELVPQANKVGYLSAPSNTSVFEEYRDEMLAAGRALGREIILAEVHNFDFEAAFASFVERQATVVIVGAFALFSYPSNRNKILELAMRHRIPVMYPSLLFTINGGLMSYESSFTEPSRLAGIYVGRIIKGESPANLPVLQPFKYKFVINLKTAKALGLTIPETLLATADEVIE